MDLSRLVWTTILGLTSAVIAGLLLLLAEAAVATRRALLAPETAPAQDGVVGEGTGPVLRVAMLGDSTASGVGVRRAADTVGRQLAARLARAGHEVHIAAAAVARSRAGDLGPQVSRALLGRPDVAVVLLGTDDAIAATRPHTVSAHVYEATRRLRSAGVRVVVGTCPDLGAAPRWPQPLRALFGHRGRKIAALQADAAQRAGGVPVDLGARTGPVFRADPGTFSEDGLHPGPDGYRLWAEALGGAVEQAAQAAATI